MFERNGVTIDCSLIIVDAFVYYNDAPIHLFVPYKIHLFFLVQLLCQFERNSVLKFLETFDNYRLEHCLRLCQEYGVTDAAAFLLERVGDVGSALVLLMSAFDEKVELLVSAVVNKFSDVTSGNISEREKLVDILKLREVCRSLLRSVLRWFKLLSWR